MSDTSSSSAPANEGARRNEAWWRTPESEYRKPVPIDPAYIDEEMDDDTGALLSSAPHGPTPSMADWIADPLGTSRVDEHTVDGGSERPSKKNVPKPAPTGDRGPRLAALPQRIDAGDHYVGSDHWVSVGKLAVVDGFTGGVLVHSTIEPMLMKAPTKTPIGDYKEDYKQNFVAETGPHGAPRSLTTESLSTVRVRYRPVAAGAHSELLTLTYRWSDGRVTTHVVELVGRAKSMTDVETSADAPRPSLREDEDEDVDATPPSLETALEAAHLIGALDLVSDAQQLGLDVARREAASYQAMPKPPPMWLELAKLAITIGTSGIANVLSRGLTSRIGEYIAKGDKAASDAFNKSNLSLALVDSLKDTMKRSASAAVSAVAVGVQSVPDGQKTPRASDASVSANSSNAFWQLQTRALVGLKSENQNLIKYVARTSLSPVAENAPLVNVSLRAMESAFRAAATDTSAEIAQTNASVQQWITLIAQQNHGAEVVGGANRPVTEMDTLRLEGPWSPNGRGVLMISAFVPWATMRKGSVDSVRIRHAQLLGVAQEITERIARMPIRDIAVPIVIEINGGLTRVTRDEVGRIRIDGALPAVANTHGEPKEADVLPLVVEAFERLLPKSLVDMGVPLKSDDASGLEDPA